MNGNDVMAWILRSPLHGMLSGGMLLITITGKKTGRTYTTPVGYFEEDGALWVITSRGRTWWRNLRGGADVDLFLKRKPVRAQTELVLEEGAVLARMPVYLKHIPQAASNIGVRMENGVPNAEDMARAAKDRLFLRLTLKA